MKNFQQRDRGNGGFRGDRGEDRGARGGKSSFNNKERGGREMPSHKAVCTECHKSCDVPFRPTGDKPVFCRDCFALKRGEDAGARGERSERNERGQQARPTHHDKTMGRAEFKRPEVKPFVAQVPGTQNSEMKNQLSDISSKLDKLISVMEQMAISKKETPAHVVVSQKTPAAPAGKVIVPKKSIPVKKVVTVPVVAAKKVVKKTVATIPSKKVVITKAPIAKKVAAKNVPAKKVVAKKAVAKKTK